MKKFAVCFSGYPRFVKRCFNNIKEDFLDGFSEYDIYANFQWNEDWQNTEIHHEFKDAYETNEINDFIESDALINLESTNNLKPLFEKRGPDEYLQMSSLFGKKYVKFSKKNKKKDLYLL
jgi:hypothetical protein